MLLLKIPRQHVTVLGSKPEALTSHQSDVAGTAGQMSPRVRASLARTTLADPVLFQDHRDARW